MAPPRKSHRPSDKEKINKVTDAIAALEDENSSPIIIADRHNAEAMEFTGAADMDGVLAWVLLLLKEIEAIGAEKCFVGKEAQRCTHKGSKDVFLFPYHWTSGSLGARAYLKFAIRRTKTDSGESVTYCHLDLHEDRPKT
ncbi:MAG: hypothetical protein MI807_01705 [Verrucomicrobiales bacterium]|nr:hypothetical protein [Verrucomicrobiales bacterium]